MTIHLVTFSDPQMTRSRSLCVSSAEAHGVDKVYESGVDEPFTERGGGYWKWKSAIIHHLLNGDDGFVKLSNGDIFIYADAGIAFINNVRYIIDRMDQDIFLFGNNWEHAHWCKRDVIEEIMPLEELVRRYAAFPGQEWEKFGKQVQASAVFFRVSDYTRAFVKEWLGWCLFEGGRLIDDSPSRTPNHPEFREHRHDQAILTTMAYREGLRLHYWPAMYNDGAFTYEKLPEYTGDDYPTLFHHHRRRNHEWEAVV